MARPAKLARTGAQIVAAIASTEGERLAANAAIETAQPYWT